MFRICRTGIFVVFLTMTSCGGWTKTLSRVKIERDIDLSSKEGQALATNNFQKGFWPEENWWEMFEDKQLASFIQVGIDTNPSLKAAEARVRQANQEAFVVRSKLLPSLSGLGSYIYSYLSKKGLSQQLKSLNPNFQLFALFLDFSYEFDFWKKNKNAYESALGVMRTKEAISQQTKMILSVSIAKHYYELQANLAKMAVFQEILENKSKLFRLTELRRINRISNTIDVNSIKQEILSLQEAIAGLAGELKLQKSLLITLLGKNPSEELKILAVWDVPERPFELPEKIGLGLLSRRPDLMSQVWNIYSITRQVGVAVAQFLPDISLTSFGGTDAVKFQDLFTSKSGSITALPFINAPIFTGGRLTGALKAKLATYESAVFDYNEMLLKAANEVVSGLVKINTTTDKLNYQCDEVVSKKENYDLVYSRYKHGIDSMLSVLTMDDHYLRARYNQIELSRDRIEATIELVRALGGGYHNKDVEEKKELNKI